MHAFIVQRIRRAVLYRNYVRSRDPSRTTTLALLVPLPSQGNLMRRGAHQSYSTVSRPKVKAIRKVMATVYLE